MDAQYLLSIDVPIAAAWIDQHLPPHPNAHLLTGYGELPPPPESSPAAAGPICNLPHFVPRPKKGVSPPPPFTPHTATPSRTLSTCAPPLQTEPPPPQPLPPGVHLPSHQLRFPKVLPHVTAQTLQSWLPTAIGLRSVEPAGPGVFIATSAAEGLATLALSVTRAKKIAVNPEPDFHPPLKIINPLPSRPAFETPAVASSSNSLVSPVVPVKLDNLPRGTTFNEVLQLLQLTGITPLCTLLKQYKNGVSALFYLISEQEIATVHRKLHKSSLEHNQLSLWRSPPPFPSDLHPIVPVYGLSLTGGRETLNHLMTATGCGGSAEKVLLTDEEAVE